MASISDIAVGILIASAILPVAFNQWFATDTATWDAGTAAIWVIVPLFAALLVLKRYSGSKGDTA